MEKTNKLDLTRGSIPKALTLLALPIVATSFLQMAYNLVDMLWIGRIGSDAVAAVGTAGYYPWFALAFILTAKVGGQVKVSQAVGKENIEAAKEYGRNAIQLAGIMAIAYMVFVVAFSEPLISFFRINDANVEGMARLYLIIVSLAYPAYFINPVITGIFTGYGDSTSPFKANTVGLVLNILLDPIFIFGFGPIPAMGVAGAALATALAQYIVLGTFIVMIRTQVKSGKLEVFKNINMKTKLNKVISKEIIKLGYPVGLHNGLFALFSMGLGRLVAQWGPVPIAVQKVGSQIESISWMTAEGFEASLASFTGQNYGARKYERIKKGYYVALAMAGAVGLFATILLIGGASTLFNIFIPGDAEALALGTTYLMILGVSQMFMCVEITTAGAFSGIGKTKIPALVGITLTGLRIPLAMLLSSESLLGLNGIWWSISSTSVLKGVILVSWFIFLLKTNKFIDSKDLGEYNIQEDEVIKSA